MEIKYPPMQFPPAPPWVPATLTQDQARSYAESTVKLNSHVYLSTQELHIEQKGRDPRIVSRKDLLAALALLDASRPQPEPFDLERAKAGDPIITRAGRKVRFVGHVPEAREHYRVVVMAEGEGVPWTYAESGEYAPAALHAYGLMMAPQQKPQPAPMWAVLTANMSGIGSRGYVFEDKASAEAFAGPRGFCSIVEVKPC